MVRSSPDISAATPPEPKRLQQQLERELEANLADLPKHCDWGCKKNSQSKKECWCGYKLHPDVIDGDIPVLTTSASLHDSQVAIPLASRRMWDGGMGILRWRSAPSLKNSRSAHSTA